MSRMNILGVALVALLALTAIPGVAQTRPVATYSIVARDPATGQLRPELARGKRGVPLPAGQRRGRPFVGPGREADRRVWTHRPDAPAS